MRNILSFVCLLLIIGCDQSQTSKKSHTKTDEISAPGSVDDKSLSKLKSTKTNSDRLLNADIKMQKLAVFVKMIGSDKLLEIKNEHWPENTDSIEYTYNILYNAHGKIVMILQGPTSQSGDWDITYKHYFDDNGKTFAFERVAGFFNSECTPEDDDAAHETITKYYNADLKLLKEYYILTDSKKHPLVKSKCTFNYNYPYEIHADLQKCIKGYKLEDLKL
nr:hypothetical protein [uncultured Mucilaginibacter sp.]